MTPLESREVIPQHEASLMMAILTTLEVSFMILENIYSTGITHDNCHLRLSYFLVQAGNTKGEVSLYH